MTNIKLKKIGHTALNNNDYGEHHEKLRENGTCTHLTKRNPLTVDSFKAWVNADVLTDEEVIKTVYDALPDVNSDSFYRNGSIHLKISPMEVMLHRMQSEKPITRKFDENKLLLRDIIQVMDEYDKASNESMIAEYAEALAKASICYVDDKYDGKENN